MPRRFLSRKPRDEIFLEQHPTPLIVRLDSSQDDDALTRLVEALHRLSFTLANVDSGPTGKLGSYRFALVFDSKSDGDLEQIQSTLRPTSASLIGPTARRAHRDRHSGESFWYWVNDYVNSDKIG